MTEFKYRLGEKVKDRITGLEGIVIGNTEWVTGCNTVTVKPQGIGTDGKTYESVGVDEPWLELIGEGISLEADKPTDPKKRGGPGRVAQKGMR